MTGDPGVEMVTDYSVRKSALVGWSQRLEKLADRVQALEGAADRMQQWNEQRWWLAKQAMGQEESGKSGKNEEQKKIKHLAARLNGAMSAEGRIRAWLKSRSSETLRAEVKQQRKDLKDRRRLVRKRVGELLDAILWGGE